MTRLTDIGEGLTRRLASGSSRRSLLARLGGVLVAAPAFPLLPNDRKAHAAEADDLAASKLSDFQKSAQTKDDTQCNYWRYCAIDGFLCTCCGGGVKTCPPGSSPSLTSWVGTCYNPDDKRSYLVAYYDCCGPSACQRCTCDNTEGAMPTYRPQGNNEIVWCFGTSSMAYHCSTAAVVGLAG